MEFNQILDCVVPSRFPKKEYQPPTEREARTHAKNLLRRLEEERAKDEDFIPYQTYAGRNRHSQSLIEAIVHPGQLVLEVGIGNQNAPTFRELLQSGERHDYQVRGLELNPKLIPKDLKKLVQRGDITHPNRRTQALLQQANIISISNLLAPGFRHLQQAEKQDTLRGLEYHMQDSATLLVTHTNFIGDTEEGFLYEKGEKDLKLKQFVYSVSARDGFLQEGGHSFNSIIDEGLQERLILHPLRASNKNILEDEYFSKEQPTADDDREMTVRVREAIAEGFKMQEIKSIQRRGDMFAVPMHLILAYAAAKDKK